MKFKPGDQVFITPMNKTGTVLQSDRGKVKVQIGTLALNIKEQDLRFISSEEVKRPAPKRRQQGRKLSPKSRQQIDLHGCRVDQALSILEETISRCIVEGAQELEVIHGIGTGKLREAIVIYLEKSDVIARFSPLEQNPGALRVWFYNTHD